MCLASDEAEMVCADTYNATNTISKMQVFKFACPMVMLKLKLAQ